MLKTGDQLKRARVLLSMDIGSLARASRVSSDAIERMEKSGDRLIEGTFGDVLQVREALIGMGIEFPDGGTDSVRLRRPGGASDVHAVEQSVGNRVLIADDDHLSRDILSRRLSRQGFVVTAASSGTQALELVTTARFHAVLLDSLMPEMPGLEVLKRLRETNNHTRVIMVSGRAFANDVEHAMSLGADGYVTKPVDFKQLIALIDGDERKDG